jgi:hypothetical protein
MPVIGTSGSTSGDGKRRVAAWPKRPRPSSTLPSRHFAATQQFGRFRSEANIEPDFMSTRPKSSLITTLPRCRTSHLRLELDPERMSDDERKVAADALRRALGLLEKGGS